MDPGARAPVAVAFSGGGDSLAALLVAVAWAGRVARPVVALHVDHGLQPQSAAWAERARIQAEQLGAGFRRLDWIGPKPSAGLSAAARAARHRLLADAARDAGCRVVLIGHTLDDQLENAVMCGAGVPVGALGEWRPSPAWPEGRGVFLARPLLGLRRAALRERLAARGLQWIDDPANGDDRYARSRARRALGDAAAILPPPADIRALAGACRATAWGGLEIDRAALAAAPGGEALRLLQMALACASGAPGLARPGRARALLMRLASDGAFTATLAGARVEADPKIVRLAREAGEAARGGLAPLDLTPGRCAVWDGRFEVRAAQAGWRMEALRGWKAQLDPADVARLRDIPASARSSLPILRRTDGSCLPVRLALAGQGDHIGPVGVTLRPLSEPRFAGAAGLVSKEVEIETIAGMANVLPLSYVGPEVKG